MFKNTYFQEPLRTTASKHYNFTADLHRIYIWINYHRVCVYIYYIYIYIYEDKIFLILILFV